MEIMIESVLISVFSFDIGALGKDFIEFISTVRCSYCQVLQGSIHPIYPAYRFDCSELLKMSLAGQWEVMESQLDVMEGQWEIMGGQ